MCRRSSPTEYCRWSANSTDEPRRLLLRSPFIRPTKIFLLTSSSCSSLWRNSGSSSGVVAVSGMGRSLRSDVRSRISNFRQQLGFRNLESGIRDGSNLSRPVREVEQAEHQGGGQADPEQPGDEGRQEDLPAASQV